MIDHDARLRCGAYVTDGRDLYEVIGSRVVPGLIGISVLSIVVEDCRNLQEFEIDLETLRASFRVVRPGPVARCPDRVDEIEWESAAAAAATVR